jgi:hypothetical protein
MARLPQPGSDTGQWGEILNDYLSQSLDTGGALKSGSVGSSQLASGAVTAAAIADGTITTAKLQDNSITGAKIANGAIPSAKISYDPSVATGIRSLLIVYSPPNIINTQYSDDYAAGILCRYDDVVLGSGLEDSGNAYHASTQSIIQKVKAISPTTVVWGYIDTGVTTSNLPLSTIQTQIDEWLAMGAGGIFLDTFGYDYHTSRSRQNSILSYVHSKNAGAMINVWNSDDALSSAVDTTYNPTGVATVAGSTDVLLLESWVCNSDSYAAPYYATISDIKTRSDKAVAYRSSLGIRIYAANIMLHTGTADNTLQNYRSLSEGMARAWRLDGTGLQASNYSSTGSDLAVVSPRFSAYRDIPKRASATYILNGAWTQVQAPDLGITITYNAGTSTFSWQQL